MEVGECVCTLADIETATLLHIVPSLNHTPRCSQYIELSATDLAFTAFAVRYSVLSYGDI